MGEDSLGSGMLEFTGTRHKKQRSWEKTAIKHKNKQSRYLSWFPLEGCEHVMGMGLLGVSIGVSIRTMSPEVRLQAWGAPTQWHLGSLYSDKYTLKPVGFTP